MKPTTLIEVKVKFQYSSRCNLKINCTMVYTSSVYTVNLANIKNINPIKYTEICNSKGRKVHDNRKYLSFPYVNMTQFQLLRLHPRLHFG